MTDRDIVDAIDALVDEQLEQEPSGYDHNINQVKCWHCDRDFHGLPITQHMQDMRMAYLYGSDDGDVEAQLAEYRFAEDDSPILCLGSTAIGPARPSRTITGTGDRCLNEYIYRHLVSAMSRPIDASTFVGRPRWWRLDNPSPDIDYEIRVEVEVDRYSDAAPGYSVIPVPPRSWSLSIRGVLSGQTVPLSQDPNTNQVYRVESDSAGKLTRIEVFSNMRPMLGGTWVPVTALGGTVHPGVDNGGPLRPGSHIFTAPLDTPLPVTPGSLEGQGFTNIGFISADTAPFLNGPEIADGDVVGYEDLNTAEILTGRATVRRDHDEWTITIGDPQ